MAIPKSVRCVILFSSCIFALATANTEKLVGPPLNIIPNTSTGFHFGKHFQTKGALYDNGNAAGKVVASLEGQLGQGPTYYSAEPVEQQPNSFNYDPTALANYNTALWSPQNVNYYATAAVIVGVLLAYVLWIFLFPLFTAGVKEAVVDEQTPEDSKKDTETVVDKKTRNRRAIQRNEEAARLASIVLSAIESGECLQKSICLMGSQIGGTERGKLAYTILEKLVPESLQENAYYTTLRKSLKGEAYCRQFRCSSGY